ncbi:class I SAM-dependent rRNA methyltransferase, partial [Candidatus Ruminimicrobium bovinum]|uniref:class I SAM-dependent rRNA methyltransferase n=1 Tax=Candidatus Ruminimicrobium bovinum TaxID=3242779 RepID=UPI0039B957EB
IAFRLISRENKFIDTNFWQNRISKAYEFRKQIYPFDNSFRVVYGESDGISGFILDKYNDYCVAQFVSAGADKNKHDILEAVENVLKPKAVVIRNDSHLRKLENLSGENEIYSGKVPNEIIIKENDIEFFVNITSGQKTGFFFDQRDNRVLLKKYCKDKKVLDCFTNTGAFGLNALKGGAKEVIFVDSSRSSLEVAEKNYKLNGYTNFNAIVADAQEYICSEQAKQENFDVVNIDPPGLIKSKKDFFAGYKHYVKLNEQAMKLLKSGGIFATSSCSHHLAMNDFKKMLTEAASRAGKTAIFLELASQAKDHPVLISMPETEYLKFAILKIL